MFPLGTPVLPGMVLPLRLFEPRYLQMYADIIDSTREFGVVLIERGLESRDDNPTFGIGCTARIIGSGLNDDGTIGLVSVGETRIKLDEWLTSDPYPRAEVTDLEDEPLGGVGMAALEEGLGRIPELMEMATRLSPEFDAQLPELSDDPVRAVYQLAQVAGLQALDLQRVLEAASSDARARLVTLYIDESIELMRLQLEVGGSSTT